MKHTRVLPLFVAALALGTLPAAVANNPVRAKAAATANDAGLRASTVGKGIGILPNFANRSARLVRLQVGAFDPAKDAAPAPKGIALIKAGALPATTPQYYLAQVRDARFAEALAAIRADHAAAVSYVPDDTYIVRATPAQAAALAQSPAIRWTGYYQPAWRVPVSTHGFIGPREAKGTQSFRVYGFRADPDVASLAARLRTIPGVKVVSDGVATVDVQTTADRLGAIAAIPFVEWVTRTPTFVPMNKDARWVIDSGIRDLYWVTAPQGTTPTRLNGAGQTAADADTAVNYVPDQNGVAHQAFRDCSDAAATVCKLADYTQKAAGTDQTLNISANNPGAPHRKMAGYFDLGGAGVNPPDPDAHGTHTSGTITGDAGVPGQYDGEDGLAPGARLVFQNISTPDAGLTLPTDYYQLFRQAYHPSNPSAVAEDSVNVDPVTGLAVSPGGNPCDCASAASYVPSEDARTHNNSYGSGLPVSLGEAESLDAFVWDHEDMAIAVAAGNSGPAAGTIDGDPAAAKNDFTSGATSNGRQPMVSIDSLTNFSSHGPTPDGRFGVTVVDPGEVVISSKGGTSDAYHYAQGTSMSTPVLTGVLTLMRQYFWDGYGPASGKGFPGGAASADKHNPSAALLKAAVVNGAERLRGYYTGDDGDNAEAQLRGQYPSAGQGFGRVNLSNSLYFSGDPENNWYYDVYRSDAEAFAASDPTSPTSHSYQIAVTDSSVPLSVAMAYTDAPNSNTAGTPSLVNDLDLTVTAPDGSTSFVGNNFNTRTSPGDNDYFTPSGPAQPDSLNNVERVRIPNPAVGTWTVTVRASSVAFGPQGFALAAHGDIAAPNGTFTPGPARQHDTTPAAAPAISNVVTTPVSADLVKVTFDTDEPTTATATGTVTNAEHTFTDVYNLGSESYYGVKTGAVETSDRYADKPVVGTKHELYLTGFAAGSQRTFTLKATDLENKASSASVSFTTPDNVFQPQATDEGQLSNPPTTGFQWTTGKQFYAGVIDGTANLGAFMFRVPNSVDPSTITGASVELTAGHDWVSNENDDSVFTLDLLDDSVKSSWGTQDYPTLHGAKAAARVAPETAFHRGGQETYAFTFSCADLGALRQSLSTSVGGQRLAPFRWDTPSPDSSGVWSADFGYNRRSRGIEYRPKLVLTTTASSAQPPFTSCDPNAPAPTITHLGVHPGVSAGTMTVSWHTDEPADSMVLFRRKGDAAWTQVSTPARSIDHQVEVKGVDPAASYEFGVRSTACNGASTTDDNGGKGYSWYFPPPPQPTAGYWFHGNAGDEGTRFTGPPYSATFDTTQPTGTTPVVQTVFPFANADSSENPLAAFWEAPVSAPVTLDGDVHFDWWWSMSDPSAVAATGDVEVRVWADPDGQGGGTVIGSAVLTMNGLSQTFTEQTGKVPVQGKVLHKLLIQATAPFINTGTTLRVAYDATGSPSGFGLPIGVPPAAPAGHTSAGPYPPTSAGDSGLNLAAVAADSPPTAADVAAGTAPCPPAAAGVGGVGGVGSGGPLSSAGYRLAAGDGGVYAFGASSHGGRSGPGAPIVGLATTPSGDGYWLAAADGGVFAYGDARFYGSMGGVALNKPVVGIASTSSGKGYWLTAQDGAVFAFGDARYAGSVTHVHLNGPVVGVAAAAKGNGYWLAASDGGVFAFGDARFAGSMGGAHISAPVVGIARDASGKGYWLTAKDGAVFAFGSAPFKGSMFGKPLVSPVAGVASTPTGRGYWLAGADGGLFAFGDAAFRGSAQHVPSPVVGVAAAPPA